MDRFTRAFQPNPTNIDIDHLGRVWVAKGAAYRGKASRQPASDRIVVLQDTYGDGKFHNSKAFWQDLELVSPLGSAVFDNVVVLPPPHLLKLTDANRDGKFDRAAGDTREVLLTGFNGKNHDHSLRWQGPRVFGIPRPRSRSSHRGTLESRGRKMQTGRTPSPASLGG